MKENRLIFVETPGKNPPKVETQTEQPTGPQDRAELADKQALEIVYNIEVSNETKEADIKTIKSKSIADIRRTSRLLKKQDENESDETKISSLKEETARRIKVYTQGEPQDGWHTLDYASKGRDKNGLTHEHYVGLGEILVDPDITAVMIQKNGRTITANRGIISKGRHKGRVGFMNENGKYVTTYTGDKFKIIKGSSSIPAEKSQKEEYLEAYKKEEDARGEYSKELTTYLKEESFFMDDKVHAKVDFEKDSIVAQIIAKLSGEQLENAQIIEREFRAAGLPAGVIAAAIVNAKAESGLRNIPCSNPNEDSAGLFQLNARGAGHGMSLEERLDPVKNCHRIIKEIKGKFGKKLLAAAAGGASADQLAAIFARDIERPARIELAMTRRAVMAKKMFGTEENPEFMLATAAKFKFKTPEGLNGKSNLESGQDTWILGSSSAYGMDEYKEGNTGICGIVGANPKNFLKNFQNTVWPRIEKFQMPKQVVLMGLAVNGLPQNPSDNNIQSQINDHIQLARFFEDRGIKVKITTVQPFEAKLASVKKFNTTLREEYPEYCMDISPMIALGSDNLHLSADSKRKVARHIKEQAQGLG